MTLRMTLDDVTVVHGPWRPKKGDVIYVGARHGSAAYMWPKTLEHGGRQHKYVCNEPMSLELAKVYGGFAKYECIDEDEEVFPRVEGVTYMNVCETRHVVLRPERLYYFTVDPNCAECMKIAKSYEGH